MVSAALTHSQILDTAKSVIPEYVTSEAVTRNPQDPSMRFAVVAIDQSGNCKNFNVCVSLAVAYRAQMATQRALDEKFGRVWSVLSAVYTADQF